jgi:hypothetical protein
MGHDLAPGVVERLLPVLVAHFQATSPAHVARQAEPAPA